MTPTEIKEEFFLRYNNALEGAPGLDTYEVSSYLTLAQEQFVKITYDISKDQSNSFELREKSRRLLNELVKDEKITAPVTSTRGLVPESVFYEIGNDVMYIVLETVDIKYIVSKKIIQKKIKVMPTTHDEFMVSYRNPFRKPNKNKAWRLDVSKEIAKTTVEIVAAYEIEQYNVRYISNPSPIIVENLTTASDIAGLGLTINGQTAESGCELTEAAQREIINLAVENAVLDYRNGTLEARMKLDSRV